MNPLADSEGDWPGFHIALKGATTMNKTSNSKTSTTKSFQAGPKGREQAYQQAKSQGEKSITFVLNNPAAKKK
jgi:hypothetical protein